MRVISFKDTILYKRGFLLSAAALIAAVAAPSVVDGSLFREPVVHIAPLCILLVFSAYFLQKGRFFSIADTVTDCGDHLRVRRGHTEIVVLFRGIASVEVATSHRIHRITIHLRERSALGSRIEFWPQASLWNNPDGVQLVAADLGQRAREADTNHSA